MHLASISADCYANKRRIRVDSCSIAGETDFAEVLRHHKESSSMLQARETRSLRLRLIPFPLKRGYPESSAITAASGK